MGWRDVLQDSFHHPSEFQKEEKLSHDLDIEVSEISEVLVGKKKQNYCVECGKIIPKYGYAAYGELWVCWEDNSRNCLLPYVTINMPAALTELAQIGIK